MIDNVLPGLTGSLSRVAVAVRSLDGELGHVKVSLSGVLPAPIGEIGKESEGLAMLNELLR